jgi:regulatory protein
VVTIVHDIRNSSLEACGRDIAFSADTQRQLLKTLKITSLEPHKAKTAQKILQVDGEEVLVLADEIAYRNGLAVGDEIDKANLARLKCEDAAWRARDAALKFLAGRQRSERELRDYLSKGGYESDTIDACLRDLRSIGLLDDVEFARAYIRDRLRFRPTGRSGIVAQLKTKGVGTEETANLFEEVAAERGESELELARRAVLKVRRGPRDDSARLRRRAYAFLMRRGFGSDTASQVAAEHGWALAGDDSDSPED